MYFKHEQIEIRHRVEIVYVWAMFAQIVMLDNKSNYFKENQQQFSS